MNPDRELRRVRCLQAMGLVVHVSRRELPGAAPTRRLALRPSTPVEAAPPATRQSSAPPARAVRAATPASVSQSSAQSPELQEREERARAPQAAERFSVAAVISGGRLWVEDLGSDALAMEQVQLMVAIGRALAHPQCDESAPRVAQFDWPLSDNPQLDLGPGEARAALRSFLLRQLEEHGCQALMVLGEAGAARIGSEDFPVSVQCLPATHSLLEDPAGKRQLWRTLRG